MQRFRRATGSSIWVLALFLMIGCGGKNGQTGKSDNVQAPVENAAALPAADNQSMGPGIAVINGVPVTGMEFEVFAREVFPQFEGKVSEEWAAAMDMLITNRLLADKARRAGLDKDPRVKSRIHLAVDQLWTEPYWNAVVRGKVKVTEEDYKKAEPVFVELLEVRQMVTDDRATAEELRAQVLKNPSIFPKLVKERSRGLTAKNGGVMPNVTRNSPQYDKATLDLLFGLKKGEISPVVETPIGAMFFELVSRITPEDARREWRKTATESVLRKKEESYWDENLARLAKKHKIKTYDENIKEYAKARESGKGSLELSRKPVFSINDTQYFVADLADPSGMGVLHGMQTLESIVNKKLNQYLISHEMDALGLKSRFKKEQLIEKYHTENILARAYLDAQGGRKEYAEADFRKYYNENKGKFLFPKSIDMSAIETLSADRVQSIYKELESGKNFATVAKEWSDNARQYPDGRIGVIEWTEVSKEFASVKSLKPGDYSRKPVVLKPKGENRSLYVILKSNRIIEKHTIPYESANKGDIEKALRAHDREKVIKSVMAGLRKENKVEIPDSYKEFVKSKLNENNPAGGKNVKKP